MLIDEIRAIQSNKQELKKFGLTVGLVCFTIGVVLLLFKKELYGLFLLGGFLLAFFGVFFPPVLKPIQKAWMIFSVILGWFMTRVILTILFYLVVTPISLFIRMTGKQLLDLKWQKSSKTYWNYREAKEFNKLEYEKQF